MDRSFFDCEKQVFKGLFLGAPSLGPQPTAFWKAPARRGCDA